MSINDMQPSLDAHSSAENDEILEYLEFLEPDQISTVTPNSPETIEPVEEESLELLEFLDPPMPHEEPIIQSLGALSSDADEPTAMTSQIINDEAEDLELLEFLEPEPETIVAQTLVVEPESANVLKKEYIPPTTNESIFSINDLPQPAEQKTAIRFDSLKHLHLPWKWVAAGVIAIALGLVTVYGVMPYLERKQAFTAAFAEGQRKHSEKDYAGALAAIKTALSIPGYADDQKAILFQREAQIADRHLNTFNSAMSEGGRNREAGSFAEAIAAYERALDVPGYADNVDAMQLFQEAKRKDDDFKKFTSTRDEGMRLYTAKQYRAAVDAFSQALSIPDYADNAEVMNLMRSVEGMAHAESEFTAILAEGKRLNEAREYVAAAEAFRKALGIPGYADHQEATILLRDAEFISVMNDGRRKYEAGDYTAAAAAFRQAREVPGYEKHETAERLQRDSDFAGAFIEGRRQFESQEHSASLASFRRAVEVPGYESHEATWQWLAHVLMASPQPENMPAQAALDCGFGVALDVVRIPAGSFMMGSSQGEGLDNEKPQRQVVISQPFYMSAYPITQEQYEGVMGINPSHFKGSSDSLRRPVETVSWNDAIEFCRRLSQKMGLDVRLPTEAEWEYACRAGVSTPFHTGAVITTEQANFDGGRQDRRNETTSVDTFQPNAWGLHDMHGNVWEWCADWSVGGYPTVPSIDPFGPENGRKRVLRGGAWSEKQDKCRSAYRAEEEPGKPFRSVGFRVAITLPTPELLAQAQIVTPTQKQAGSRFMSPPSTLSQAPLPVPLIQPQPEATTPVQTALAAPMVSSIQTAVIQSQSESPAPEIARRREEFTAAMKEGIRRYETRDFSGAEAEITRALAIPGYEEIPVAKQWLTAVRTAIQRQNMEAQRADRSRRAFQAAMVEGQGRYEQGDYIGAMTVFRQALGIPGYAEIPEAKQWLALTQAAEANRRAEMERNNRDQGNYQAAMREGQQRYETGDYIGAATAFGRALAVPGYSDAHDAKKWLAATRSAEEEQRLKAQQAEKQQLVRDDQAKKFFMGVAGAVLGGVLNKNR